jgi:lipopolysaccharide transport system permease protein
MVKTAVQRTGHDGVSTFDQPTKPLEKIRHIKPKQSLRSWMHELYQRREVLLMLLWKDTKVQYSHWWLGIAWSLFQPLVYLIAAMIFVQMGNRNIATDQMPVPLFLFSGITVWNLFTSGVNNSSNALRSNAHLITKADFPRAYIIIAPVIRAISDFMISILLLIIAALSMGVNLGPTSFINIMPVLIIMGLTTLSVASMLSLAILHHRHVLHAVPVVMYALLFVLPIFHQSGFTENGMLSYLYDLNPVAVSIRLLREMTAGPSVPLAHTSFALLTAFALLIFATVIFRKKERSISDML